jgi:type IV pilus biogenesis protein PilP
MKPSFRKPLLVTAALLSVTPLAALAQGTADSPQPVASLSTPVVEVPDRAQNLTVLQRSIDVLSLQVQEAALRGKLKEAQGGANPSAPAPGMTTPTASLELRAVPTPPATAPWFDAQTFRSSRPQIIEVVGVRSKRSANLLLPDGSEMPVHIGADLPDGSKVTAIDVDGVGVTKDGRHTRLAFIPTPKPVSRTSQPQQSSSAAASPAAVQNVAEPPRDAAPADRAPRGDVRDDKTGS